MWIKIIRKRIYEGLQAELETLRRKLDELIDRYESLLRRYGREIAVRDRRIESLILALRKAEYDKEEALKKLTRYEA